MVRLRTHELGPDGTLCRDAVRPWRGVEMALVSIGSGDVTCGRCARVRNANMPARDIARADDVEALVLSVGARTPDEPE